MNGPMDELLDKVTGPAAAKMSGVDLTVIDMTAAVSAAMIAKITYQKVHSLHTWDANGRPTGLKIVGFRATQAEFDSGEAAAKMAKELDILHAEKPIFAVLGNLCNGMKLDNDTYAVCSYIARVGDTNPDNEAIGSMIGRHPRT